MDRTLSWLGDAHIQDATEIALAEIDAAIAMVVLGAALSVRLINLALAEESAFDAAARAQAAGVGFSLDRDASGSVALIIGPRHDEDPA